MTDIPSLLIPTEYHAALERLQRIEDRLLWIGAGGGVISLSAATYVLINRAGLEIGPAWIAPLPFLITVTLLLGLFVARLVTQTQISVIRAQASEAPISIPFQPAQFYTPLLQRLMLLPGAALLVLYFLTLAYSLRSIYTVSHAAGTIFGISYLILNITVGISGVAIWRLWRGLPALTATELRKSILPYPATTLPGIGLFVAGFSIPILTIGLNTDQFNVLNALFRRAADFTYTVPWAAVAALGLGYFLILEGLLIPAGRLWLALRQGEKTPHGYAIIIIRLAAAFPLAYALGGLPFLGLCLLVWVQQAISALNAVPIGAPLPPLRIIARQRFDLLWDGLLDALRFYAGILVWIGPAWSFTVLLLLFCAVAFLSIALKAAWQARRARIQTFTGQQPAEFALRQAWFWQHVGFLAASLTLFGLLILQTLAETNDFFNSYLAVGYGRFNNGAVQYSQAGLVNGLLLTIDLLLFGLLACALYVRLLRVIGPTLALATERVRAWLVPLLFISSLGLAIITPFVGLFSLAVCSFLAAVLGTALWCER